MCIVGDNDSITGVDANVVYVSDMCKNSELRDDQCGGHLTLIHRSLGFNKGMSIAPLSINGLRTQFDEVALLIQNKVIHKVNRLNNELKRQYFSEKLPCTRAIRKNPGISSTRS